MKWMSLLQDFSEPLIYCDTKRMHITCNIFQTSFTLVGHLPFQEGLHATTVPLRMAKPGLREEEAHSDVHVNGQVASLPCSSLSHGRLAEHPGLVSLWYCSLLGFSQHQSLVVTACVCSHFRHHHFHCVCLWWRSHSPTLATGKG